MAGAQKRKTKNKILAYKEVYSSDTLSSRKTEFKKEEGEELGGSKLQRVNC